ncbi:OB-fold putative lipoprotein [Flavobacteriaceae bacterium]|nr:OB-fold putative lipoprotein [Flavobacteriaceae bacterium]MDB4289773.1 OB-fold putative lipoprotein [Flavobacteriaceae bacterium]
MRNKIIFSLILVFGIIIAYNYMYPDHRSISEETVSFTLDAESLFNEFTEDSQQAELKYLDQTIIVSGVISSINSKSVTISNKIYGQFETLNSDLKVNDSIAVKGRCIGYDDLLEEIKLDQCSIIK